MPIKTLEEVTKEARAHVIALIDERKARASGLHLDDHRIPREIAEHMYQLGRMEKGLRDQNQRWVEATRRNNSSIDEVRGLYALLQMELDIATHRESVAAQP